MVSIDQRIQDAEVHRINGAAKLDQTLGSFKQLLLEKHALRCPDYVFVFIGRELKDDELTLGDLGFAEECTVHAGMWPAFLVLPFQSHPLLEVAVIQFSVDTQADEEYEFALKATTRVSEIRKLLHEVDANVAKQDEYAFSLDGVHALRESSTLWDLNIYSGTRFILSKLLILIFYMFNVNTASLQRIATSSTYPSDITLSRLSYPWTGHSLRK